MVILYHYGTGSQLLSWLGTLIAMAGGDVTIGQMAAEAGYEES